MPNGVYKKLGFLLVGLVLAGAANAEIVAYKFVFGPTPYPTVNNVPDGSTIYIALDTAHIWGTGSNSVFSFIQWYVEDMEVNLGELTKFGVSETSTNTVYINQYTPEYFGSQGPQVGYYDLFGVQAKTSYGADIGITLASYSGLGQRSIYPYFGFIDPPIPMGVIAVGELNSPVNLWVRLPDGTYTQGRLQQWTYCQYGASLNAGGCFTSPLSLTLKNSISTGCRTNVGTVTLTSPAPAAGAVVTLSDTLNSVKVPASIKFLAGETTKTFTVSTTAVAANESGTVSATLGSVTVSQPLTVRPMSLSSVKLSPATVAGSNTVAGTATLECKAGPGPVEVVLASSNGAVASPVAPSVFVPQGVQSALFDVTTSAVMSKTSATISGTANGTTKSKSLTVTPMAAVSTSSLKFYSQAINTTSGVLYATLYNKGALPYSILGITLTGVGAAHYARTTDCGATLSAGASCSIGVTFKPTSTGSKQAKVSVATSATATPLSVSLSGTGVL